MHLTIYILQPLPTKFARSERLLWPGTRIKQQQYYVFGHFLERFGTLAKIVEIVGALKIVFIFRSRFAYNGVVLCSNLHGKRPIFDCFIEVDAQYLLRFFVVLFRFISIFCFFSCFTALFHAPDTQNSEQSKIFRESKIFNCFDI